MGEIFFCVIELPAKEQQGNVYAKKFLTLQLLWAE